MKSIVVLSGKGGVGKSSITASLAVALSKSKKIICADCDVDASNLSLLFGISINKYLEWKKISTNQKAVVDKSKCIGCGKCVNICYFDALKLIKGTPIVSKFGCEGCGACELICPVGAIKLIDIYNAHIGYAKTKYKFTVVSAQLEPGSSGSGKVVAEVKNMTIELSNDDDILLIDSSAGTGCPVIASVTGSDYAILVTEPTPSGFADLKKALDIVEHFKINRGIIINKYDLNLEYTNKILEFAKKKQMNVLEKIPFSKDFVFAMNEMVPIIDFDYKYRTLFENIKIKLLKELY